MLISQEKTKEIKLANYILSGAIKTFLSELEHISKKLGNKSSTNRLETYFAKAEKEFIIGLMGYKSTTNRIYSKFQIKETITTIDDLPSFDVVQIMNAPSNSSNKTLKDKLFFYCKGLTAIKLSLSGEDIEKEMKYLKETLNKYLCDGNSKISFALLPLVELIDDLNIKYNINKSFFLSEEGDFSICSIGKIANLNPKTRCYWFLKILTENQKKIVPCKVIIDYCCKKSGMKKTDRGDSQLCSDIKQEIQTRHIKKAYKQLFKDCIQAKKNPDKEKGLILSLP